MAEPHTGQYANDTMGEGEFRLSVGGGVHNITQHNSSADWWDHLLPGLAKTPDRRDRRFLVAPPKDTGPGKVG